MNAPLKIEHVQILNISLPIGVVDDPEHYLWLAMNGEIESC